MLFWGWRYRSLFGVLEGFSALCRGFGVSEFSKGVGVLGLEFKAFLALGDLNSRALVYNGADKLGGENIIIDSYRISLNLIYF